VKREHLFGIIAAVAFAGPVNAQVTLDQVKDAATVEEFIALGGRLMTAEEFRDRVVGRELDEGSWTWYINPDGTHSARADDGSWQDSGGRWELRGNQYCRNGGDGGEMGCGDIYEIGGYLRMGDDDGVLAGWTVKIN
jgi:hypothetical protein